ncbi:MAG: putative transporter ATP-binding protein YxlF [Planctomycetota bacterium]
MTESGIVQDRGPGAVPVRLDRVEKRYGRRLVLAGVSLDIPPGITGLVGPNGAGKSTLVRAILGLVRLAAGRVEVFGHDPAVEPRVVRQLIGVVPEDDASIPGLSGVEMVQYAARLAGLPGKEALRRAHEVLDWCDAGQERYRAVETLSVGMRQKVAFAAAIVHDPTVVILDEPTNGLDPLERRAMLGRLVTLARDHGKTILVSTHVLRDVQSICDRLALLVRGRVRLAGSIADLTETADRDLRLRATGPLPALVRRLAARGVAARVADDDESLLVHAAEPAAIAAIWEEAAAAGVEAWALEPERRPLEEVFLAALQAADEADAGRLAHAPA